MLAHHPQRTVWLLRSLLHRTTYSLGQSETTRGPTIKTTHIQANWEDRAWGSAELWVRGFWSVRKSKCRERYKIWILRRRMGCGAGKVKQTWLRTWEREFVSTELKFSKYIKCVVFNEQVQLLTSLNFQVFLFVSYSHLLIYFIQIFICD